MNTPEKNPYQAPRERDITDADDSTERVGTLIGALYVIVFGLYLLVIAPRRLDSFVRRLWHFVS